MEMKVLALRDVILIQDLLNSAPETLDYLDISIVPMANIDGYLKISRYASNGLDLNRDNTKLMAPETIALKKAFNKFLLNLQ